MPPKRRPICTIDKRAAIGSFLDFATNPNGVFKLLNKRLHSIHTK